MLYSVNPVRASEIQPMPLTRRNATDLTLFEPFIQCTMTGLFNCLSDILPAKNTSELDEFFRNIPPRRTDWHEHFSRH